MCVCVCFVCVRACAHPHFVDEIFYVLFIILYFILLQINLHWLLGVKQVFV